LKSSGTIPRGYATKPKVGDFAVGQFIDPQGNLTKAAMPHLREQRS
jgi:hypothetical protein